MKAKLRIFAASVFIVLSISLGTGYLMFGAGALANNNYSPLGLYALNFEQQTKSSNLNISNSLNFSTNLDIEALTLDQIKVAKHSIEDAVNNAFMNWQMQKIESGELKPFTSPPNNESVKALFFQFLSERLDCAERFAQYDQMLSRENELRTPEIVNESIQSLQQVNYIVQQGKITSELNETKTINGTTYYIVTREYSLTINGTTQNVTKITVTTDDGTVIMDPYFRINQAQLLWPCYVWVFWWPYYIGWWPTVVLYGYDWYMCIFFTPGLEASAYLANVYLNLPLASMDAFTWASTIASFAGGLYGVGAAVAGTVTSAAATVLSAVGLALAVVGIIGHYAQAYTLDRYKEVLAYNEARDWDWGWMECDYWHNPMLPPKTANPPCYDEWNKIVPYLVSVDGAFWPKTLGDAYFLIGEPIYYSYINLVTAFGSLYGFGNWVWLGTGSAPSPPPS